MNGYQRDEAMSKVLNIHDITSLWQVSQRVLFNDIAIKTPSEKASEN